MKEDAPAMMAEDEQESVHHHSTTSLSAEPAVAQHELLEDHVSMHNKQTAVDSRTVNSSSKNSVEEPGSTAASSTFSWVTRIPWFPAQAQHVAKDLESLAYENGEAVYHGGAMENDIMIIAKTHSRSSGRSRSSGDSSTTRLQRISSRIRSFRRTRTSPSEDSLADFQESEWTPPDSSYGAAFPVAGWIPKRIRRSIEWLFIALVVLCLAYLIVATSLRLQDKSGGGGSNVAAADDNNNVVTDDTMFYQKQSNDDDNSAQNDNYDDGYYTQTDDTSSAKAPADDDYSNNNNNSNNGNQYNGNQYNNNNNQYNKNSQYNNNQYNNDDDGGGYNAGTDDPYYNDDDYNQYGNQGGYYADQYFDDF